MVRNLLKVSEHYPITLTESMQDDYWEALKQYDRDRLEGGFRRLINTWEGKFYRKPAELRVWLNVYMADTKPPTKQISEPEITEDMQRRNLLAAHFYVSVCYTSRAAKSKDSVVEWMKTKNAKCRTKARELCATPEDPDWVDKQYRRING